MSEPPAGPTVVDVGGVFYAPNVGGQLKVIDPDAAPSATVRLNPYAGVDWSAVVDHPAVEHLHADPAPQTVLNEVWTDAAPVQPARKLFTAFSRYYPEQPMTAADFTSVPANTVLLSNSEQFGCTDSLLHFCPIGTTYTNNGGTQLPWRDAFTAALGTLIDPDGGGITINHPVWSSSVKEPTIRAMLDHDPRVLGIEVYNHAVVHGVQDYRSLPAYPLWDRLLATGRRCWGFWAWDHYDPARGPYRGVNMLLLTTPTASAAYRAYRNGEFYGSMTQGLRLTGVTVAGRFVTITTDVATTLRMFSDGGNDTRTGPSATFLVPEGARYARFEGDGNGDTIYTQPILY